MKVRMLPNDAQPGWLDKLIQKGIKGGHNFGPFGRTNWIFRLGNASLWITQGKSTALTNDIENPTSDQQVIIDALFEIGIASPA